MRYLHSAQVVLALAVLIAFAFGLQQLQAADVQGRTLTIVAKDGSFTPAQLQAQPGETIHLTLSNRGKLPHSIVFLLPDGPVALQGEVAPGESGTLVLSVPNKSGEFVFYCPVDNHRAMGMEGRLIVAQIR